MLQTGAPLLFLAAALALNISPGPDMLYVISRSLAGEKSGNRFCVENWRRNSGLHPCDRSWPFRPTVFIANIVQRDQIRRGSIPRLLGISDAVREGREDARGYRR